MERSAATVAAATRAARTAAGAPPAAERISRGDPSGDQYAGRVGCAANRCHGGRRRRPDLARRRRRIPSAAGTCCRAITTAIPAVKPSITGAGRIAHVPAQPGQGEADEHQPASAPTISTPVAPNCGPPAPGRRSSPRSAPTPAGWSRRRPRRPPRRRRPWRVRPGRRAGRDAERERQGQRHDRHRQPGQQILLGASAHGGEVGPPRQQIEPAWNHSVWRISAIGVADREAFTPPAPIRAAPRAGPPGRVHIDARMRRPCNSSFATSGVDSV